MTPYMHNKGMILSLKCVTAPYLRRAVVAANPFLCVCVLLPEVRLPSPSFAYLLALTEARMLSLFFYFVFFTDEDDDDDSVGCVWK